MTKEWVRIVMVFTMGTRKRNQRNRRFQRRIGLALLRSPWRRPGVEMLEDRRMLAHMVQFFPSLPSGAELSEVQLDYRVAAEPDWTTLPEFEWNLIGPDAYGNCMHCFTTEFTLI